MHAIPYRPAPRERGLPKHSRATSGPQSCPIRVKPFARRMPSVLHGQVRRGQIPHDAAEALRGCVFCEPPTIISLPRVTYADAEPAAVILEATHDWTTDGTPGPEGRRPPAHNGSHKVERHRHTVGLSTVQLQWIKAGHTLIVTTAVSGLTWLQNGQEHEPPWLADDAQPSQSWRLHSHVFAFRDDGWASPAGRADWARWGWTSRAGQPMG